MSFPDLSKAYSCPITGRYYDPLRCHRELLSEPDLNVWIANDDHGRLVPHARKVFGLPEIDPATGFGWTESMVLAALGCFTEYLQGKDERAQNSSSSAPCTDCP